MASEISCSICRQKTSDWITWRRSKICSFCAKDNPSQGYLRMSRTGPKRLVSNNDRKLK